MTIANNVVEKNDKAFNTSLPADAGCPSSPTDADDCGEGIHLMAATGSQIIGNTVAHNVGGILLSDGGFGIFRWAPPHTTSSPATCPRTTLSTAGSPCRATTLVRRRRTAGCRAYPRDRLVRQPLHRQHRER